MIGKPARTAAHERRCALRRAVPTGLNAATLIGDKVTIEPHAILRSCRVESKCIVGARSIICEGAVMEGESILAPNSVVPPARRIPEGELWGGNPAKFIRKLTAHEVRGALFLRQRRLGSPRPPVGRLAGKEAATGAAASLAGQAHCRLPPHTS
jgi:carbonic anhydrase/acetyltransferase-like protein (isoleucine patch superfamily)